MIQSPESKRLKLFRKTFKITQQHIANTIGKTRQLISQYEKGIVPMPLDFVKAMHRHYRLNYTWFFEGRGKMRVDEPERRTLITDLKEVMSDVDVLKAKVESMDAMLKELHAAFYAFKYQRNR